jgi:hypothetical protein
MKKTNATVFLCSGKDCRKAWKNVCGGSPRKWLKRQVEAAGLHYRLHIVKTDCMDRCETAANLCCVHDRRAVEEQQIRSADDADRVLAGLRSCVEAGPLGAGLHN